MAVPFTRTLGARPGVQLNPLKDNTERFEAGTEAQTFAMVGRFERGRIDKPIRVNSGNIKRLLGNPTSAKVNRLNETFVHIYEALKNGAYEGIIWRLNVTSAVRNSMFVVADAVAANCLSTAGSAPVGTIITVNHMECFNDGVNLSVNGTELLAENLTATATSNVPLTGTTPLVVGGVTVANGNRVKLPSQTTSAENGTYTVGITGGNYTLTPAATLVEVATKGVTLRLRDVTTDELLYEFEGSLDPLAKDEFGQSLYLPNVVSALTEDVTVEVAANASIAPTCAFYGKTSGVAEFVDKDLVYFTEGGTSYDSEDFDRACTGLKYGPFGFSYIGGGGTRSAALLAKLYGLALDINKQFVWDVAGDLSPSAALTFLTQLNFDSHYSQHYWAPLLTDDPVNGGKDYIGTSGLQIGLRCRRNAATDANGIPAMNYPIAGKDYALPRTGIVQTYTPSDQELDDLAEGRINPVIYVRYNSGGRFVFSDSLTGAKTASDRKLIAVAEMATQLDDWIAAFGQEVLQLPMAEAIKRMTTFTRLLFNGLEGAKWLIPSTELEGRSYIVRITPNTLRPKDRMDVEYWTSYDGTNRAVHVQQTISR